MTERRAARRYDLCFSAVIRTPVGGRGIQQQGTTRDVSTRGVYLVLDRAVSKNTDFDLTMVLPTDAGGGIGVFVRAVGKVVRIEEWTEDGKARIGVAAMIGRYEIVRNDPASRPVPSYRASL